MLTIPADIRSSLELMGWSLLHFVWQGAVLAILLLIVLGLVRKSAARIREGLALLTLGLMGLCPVVTACWMASESPTAQATLVKDTRPAVEPVVSIPAIEPQSYDLPAVPAVEVPAAQPSTTPELATFDSPPSTAAPEPHWQLNLSDSIPWLAVAWLCGVLGLSFRLVMGWRIVQRLRRLATPITTGPWREAFDAPLLTQMKLSAPVQLAESILVEVPTVIGWWSPVILVPASLLSGMSSHEMAAILAHELAHIRRHDYLINLCQTVIETLLFYHPAVWWVSGRIRQEREQACDDEAVAMCGDVVTYARALLALEEHRLTRNPARSSPLVVAASGGSLSDRISRLIDPASTVPQTPGLACFVVIAAAALLIGAISVTTQTSGEARSDKPARETVQEKGAIDPPSSTIQASATEPAEKKQEAEWRPLLRKDLEAGVPLEPNHLVAIVDGDPIYALDLISKSDYQLRFKDAEKRETDQLAQMFWSLRHPLKEYNNDYILRSGQIPHFLSGLKKYLGSEPGYYCSIPISYALAKKYKRIAPAAEIEAVREAALKKFDSDLIPWGKQLLRAGIINEGEDVGKKRYGDLLESSRKQFIEREMAIAFFEFTAHTQPKPTDGDIKARYQEQFTRFHTPEGTRWQRIDIHFDKYPTRELALAAAEALHKEIQSGLHFDLAASQRSDSSLAAISGLSHWMLSTELNELSNEKLRTTLKTLPEGEISSVIELENCYSIVRVVGRRQESTVPLESLSSRLTQEIWDEQNAEAQWTLINQLFNKADIHTILDADWDEYWDIRLGQSDATDAKAQGLAVQAPVMNAAPVVEASTQRVAPSQPHHLTASQRLNALFRRDIGPDRTLKPDDVVAVFYGQPLRAIDFIPYEEQIPSPRTMRLSPLGQFDTRVRPVQYQASFGFQPTPRLFGIPAVLQPAFNPYQMFGRRLFSQVRWLEMTPAEQATFESDLNVRFQADIDDLTKRPYEWIPKPYEITRKILRERFRERALAEQFLTRALGEPRLPTEAELHQLYEQKYSKADGPTGVRWQQIDIRVTARTTREEAHQRADALRKEINNGLPFLAAHRSRTNKSPSPCVKDSLWTPTVRVDALESPLKSVLNDLVIDEVSPVIELKESFTIIRLVGRDDGKALSFAKASAKLTETFLQSQRDAQSEKLRSELWKKADAHTILDPDWDEYWAMHQKP